MSSPRLLGDVVAVCALCPFLMVDIRRGDSIHVELKCQRNYLVGSGSYLIGSAVVHRSNSSGELAMRDQIRTKISDMAKSVPTWCTLDYARNAPP